MKALDTMRLWLVRCADPKQVEYIFAVDEDDVESAKQIVANIGEDGERWGDVQIVTNEGVGCAPAWDTAYRESSGNLLIQVSDDVVPPPSWDRLLLGKLPEGWEKMPLVIAVNDGLRKDRLMCVAIATADYANECGYFISPDYFGIFSDNEFSIRAYASGHVIEARDLLFKHEHHCCTPHVADDDTYRRQSSEKAYKNGLATFQKRNPGVSPWM